MTMWALIIDGRVTQLAQTNPAGRYHPTMQWVACGDEVALGWRYADEGFLPPAPPAMEVPATISMRQARLCLHAHGLLASVQPAIDALPEPDRTAAQIEWDYSAAVERHRGFVVTIGQALGLDDAQLDALFIEAATL